MRLLRLAVPRPDLTLVSIFAGALLIPGVLSAQLFERATVVDNVRLRLSSGRAVDASRIVIKGGRIVELGPEASKPPLSRTVDGAGRTVTAGFIDIDSRLALGRGGGGAVARAWDGFDRYDTDAIGEAFAGGVTTVCLVPGGAPGIHGTAAVVRLAPRKDGGIGEVVREDVALCLDLGSSQTPIARLRTLASVRKLFRSALDHREALDIYEEELEEYTKALKERAAKSEEGKDEKEKKKDEQEDEKEKNGKKNENDKKKDTTLAQPPPAPTGGAKGAKKPDEDKAPKKPRPPKRRSDLEVILRAIDRELPVRIEAHRSADILNALELAAEFGLDLVLCGASEAHLVAESIAEAEARVILEGESGGEGVEVGARRRRSGSAGAILEDAGVSWIAGSGGESSRATRHLWLHGVRASRGTDRNPFALITTEAARYLGIGTHRFARLERGAHADLVFWSADPLEDPTARVLEVWMAGAKVWTAPESAPNPKKATRL